MSNIADFASFSLSLSRQSRQQRSLPLLHESASFSLSLAAVSEPRRQRTSCFQKKGKNKLKVTWVPYPSEEAYFREIRAVGEKKFFFAPFLFSSNQRSRRRKDFRALFPGRKTKGATFFGTLNRPVPLQFFKVFREKGGCYCGGASILHR